MASSPNADIAVMFQFDLPPPTFRPDLVLGPWLIGLIIEVLLTGVIFVMFLEYWRDYAYQDRRRIKYFVVLSVLLSIFKSGIVTATAWYKLISGFASYTMVTTPNPWYGKVDPLVAVVMILLAQTFFLLRLSALLGGTVRLVLVPIVAAMMLSFGSYVGTTVQLFSLNKVHANLNTVWLRRTETMGTFGLMATESMISLGFCFILIKSKTGMPRTDSLVARLVLLSWTTALVPTLCDLVKHITYLTGHDQGRLFIAFSHTLPKLYVTAMFVTLNVRSQLRGDVRFHLSAEYQLSVVVLPGSGNPSSSPTHPKRPGHTIKPRFNLKAWNNKFLISRSMQFADPPDVSGDSGEVKNDSAVASVGTSDAGDESKTWAGTESSDGSSSRGVCPAAEKMGRETKP